MSLRKKIYEGPYSSVKKVEVDGQILVRKKYRYSKYRAKEDLRDIYQKCKDLDVKGFVKVIGFEMDDFKLVSFYPFYEFDLY